MSYQVVKEDVSQEKSKILLDGLNANSKEKRDLDPIDLFGFYVKDGNKIIGGIQGIVMYGSVWIQLLWLSKNIRNKGYGKKMMQEVENFTKEKKCKMILVETFDFEALDFYKKLGFKVDFKREGFFKNCIFYYLRKII